MCSYDKNGRRIGVLIPALNEEQSIAKVIADIPQWVDRIIVVDNGSTDQTAEIAKRAGAIIVHEAERGYGAACQKGLASLTDMDIIVFIDGDYSDHPEEMSTLVDPIINGECHMVIGSRLKGRSQKGALTIQQRIGNRLACTLMYLFWGVCYSDLGPFRAIDANALRQLGMNDRNFGWTIEMQIKVARAGLKFIEVPVSYRPRIGTSKISGSIMGTIKAGVKILAVITRFALTPKRLSH